jgi:hypothetical protein
MIDYLLRHNPFCPGSNGMTLWTPWRIYILLDSSLTGEHRERVRRHEECHVAQMRRDGALKWHLRYVWQWLTVGYARIDYEIEAEIAEV